MEQQRQQIATLEEEMKILRVQRAQTEEELKEVLGVCFNLVGLKTEASCEVRLQETVRVFHLWEAFFEHLKLARKIQELEKLGVEVKGRIPVEPVYDPNSLPYLQTKVKRMGHLINLDKSTEPET